MSGFDVEIADLRESAKAARDASSQARALSGAQDVRAAVPAMPAGATPARLESLATRWAGEMKVWADAAIEYADQLDSSATGYQGSDGAAAADFDRTTGHR